jgi:hypothetical protein
MPIGIVALYPIQSVDDFSGMNAESTVCSHHKGFEGPTNILCRQTIFANFLRLVFVQDSSGGASLDVGRAIHGYTETSPLLLSLERDPN